MSIVEYLINKGKSEEGINNYLGVEVTNMDSYTIVETCRIDKDQDENNQRKAVIGMMTCFTGEEGDDRVETKELLPFVKEEI